jgi:hypothetical protein
MVIWEPMGEYTLAVLVLQVGVADSLLNHQWEVGRLVGEWVVRESVVVVWVVGESVVVVWVVV